MAEHRFQTPGPVELVVGIPTGEIDIETVEGVQSFRPWLGGTVAMIDARRPDIPDFPERNRMPAEALTRMESLARELIAKAR